MSGIGSCPWMGGQPSVLVVLVTKDSSGEGCVVMRR